MNISTMHNKLLCGEYKNPLHFCDDAWLYNNKPLRVYKMCTKLAKLFVESIDRVVQKFGYCCGRQYAYLPKLMLCYGKQQCWEISPYGYYYYSNSEPLRFNLSSGKYTFCANCFHSIKSESILIGDDSTRTLVEIPKQIFLLAQNDIREPEIMIDCIVCTRLQQLPVTDLSSRLEEHVNQFLLDKYCHKSRVTIRVLYSSDKICEIKPQLKKYYLNQVADNNYPYRTKVILAFQEIESVDVVFFSMYTQEYAECYPVPNTYRVYIYIIFEYSTFLSTETLSSRCLS
ncbi:unnamed protein product [Rotaria sp. Silwood2]|nr:unnamed protein product [Rotaria sp. Silwood2]